MLLRSRGSRFSPLVFCTGVLGLGLGAGCGGEVGPDAARPALITGTDDLDCPPTVPCDAVPAAYAVTDAKTGSYGNYDLADRDRDGQAIRYIVIHTTEGSYAGTLSVFQDPKYAASAHYVIRSRDGHLAKMISPEHVAWHAGNWYFNMHSVGIEHEAASAAGHSWFTDELYATSAALVRHLAARYNIPLDREHIIGHDEVPGLSQARTPAMHWDPGPYWDWDRFMRMLRPGGGEAPGDRRDDGSDVIGPVRIQPDYESNLPTVSYCFGTGGTDCRAAAPQSSNFLYLRTEPRASAPLIVNRYLAATPADRMYNWGNKAGSGRLYYRLETSGDWDAIYFGGQAAWFYNPGHRFTRIPLLRADQAVITPKAGSGSIAVYGGGYPGDAAYKPPTTPQRLEKVYDLPEGQRYIAQGPITADYYWARVWAATLPMASHKVVADSTPYYVVSFNHRLALVRAQDVTVVRTTRGHGGGPERLTAEPRSVAAPSAAAPAPEAAPADETSPDQTSLGEVSPGETAAMPLRDLRGLE
jgi:hypothetical protein